MTNPTTVSNSIKNYHKVNKKSCIKHEVQAYLVGTNNNNNLGPLEWWQVNVGKYRNVALVELVKIGCNLRQLTLQAIKWHPNVGFSGYFRTVESPC